MNCDSNTSSSVDNLEDLSAINISSHGLPLNYSTIDSRIRVLVRDLQFRCMDDDWINIFAYRLLRNAFFLLPAANALGYFHRDTPLNLQCPVLALGRDLI